MRSSRLFRSTSLRTRVAIASAIAASAVVAVFAILTSVVLANNDAAQLDRRLDSIIDASFNPEQFQDPRRGVLTTGRARATGELVFQRGAQLPELPPGTSTVEVNGAEYRVRTIELEQDGGLLMSIGIRADSILLSSNRIPLYVVIGVVTVLIAGGLGWLLAGPAVRPLRKLTEHTSKLGSGTEPMPEVRGVREAEDLSEAMGEMLIRLAAAQRATTNSLQAAQDFAANAAHELRTPLTAMRADLDTLRIHNLPEAERDEVVADLSRTQRRVEAIITALGQLASGQLAQDEDRELIDVTEMLYRVARENMRPGGAVEIDVQAGGDVGTVLGWPAGLRLAVDNLVRNAITHGEASRIVLTAQRRGRVLTIVVDDNGRGLPAEEHETVLGRFRRGSTAGAGGSGLGLALVVQQAELHGGDIKLSDGPLGGLRATLTVRTMPDPVEESDQFA
ncbi:sensor-type histidine kinase PrrB [Mycolicibacterium mageritense DSM 44476 = CIP 104973]|uniref:histidine kinase n=1 Tax=Mycolicibacterium mageritense TaxID=53462 RepID=A0AAI8TTM1_MYCME|nr:HAMP domain-containing sensor histidine kinase [Mycolicibacterium mageritense]MCC9180314.1 HAMP domain-containing histidine kinase [Mycolicibacterium mageritense]TXI65027.1 MAG: HAMP domain-containing histidine kinase [Mycolicibacterium mageritense]BDY28639.1 Sensor-type histidine kinase PrrB [Mycolicibacterium mageritense]CDO22754.1 sensor-type histidine kinase PrrB [Mycolicibacterium mageritense DSM 44476 = CIP 104973]